MVPGNRRVVSEIFLRIVAARSLCCLSNQCERPERAGHYIGVDEFLERCPSICVRGVETRSCASASTIAVDLDERRALRPKVTA
ncbi:MAG: hypothetical protein H6711_15305 [Myxococcales bacterium]|nr:hypothetical protein [Myxococcales bacterium]